MGYHIDIQRFSLMHDYYAIFDTDDFYINSILEQNNIKMKVLNSFRKPNCKYIIWHVRIRKKDKATFFSVLDQLEKKILILGYTDYPEFCTGIIAQISKEYEKVKNGNKKSINIEIENLSEKKEL